jgi:hypothetical protein
MERERCFSTRKEHVIISRCACLVYCVASKIDCFVCSEVWHLSRWSAWMRIWELPFLTNCHFCHHVDLPLDPGTWSLGVGQGRVPAGWHCCQVKRQEKGYSRPGWRCLAMPLPGEEAGGLLAPKPGYAAAARMCCWWWRVTIDGDRELDLSSRVTLMTTSCSSARMHHAGPASCLAPWREDTPAIISCNINLYSSHTYSNNR